MNRDYSACRLSSRSLSKLKTKIDVAFSRPPNNQNQQNNIQHNVPARSASTKSLAKSKYDSADRNLPFSTAVKNGLIQSNRKSSTHQTPYASRIRDVFETQRVGVKQGKELQCRNMISGQKIKGYSWFHSEGKEIISVFKKTKDQNLRYFAIRQNLQGKEKKRMIAAIEDGVLYAGNKKYILLNPKNEKLMLKDEAQKVQLKGTPFIIITNESVINMTNPHRLINLLFELIADGVRNVDTLAKVIGRRAIEVISKSGQRKEEIFMLIILVEKGMEWYNKVDRRQ